MDSKGMDPPLSNKTDLTAIFRGSFWFITTRIWFCSVKFDSTGLTKVITEMWESLTDYFYQHNEESYLMNKSAKLQNIHTEHKNITKNIYKTFTNKTFLSTLAIQYPLMATQAWVMLFMVMFFVLTAFGKSQKLLEAWV